MTSPATERPDLQAVPGSAVLDTNLVPVARRLTGSLLFLLAGLAALGALSTNIILPAFPDMGSALGVSTKDLGVTLSSFFVAFAAGQLLVGPLSDRFGRRWLVLGGLAVFLAGSALCAVATSLPWLVAGRVVQALGVCAASVLSRAIARDLFEGEALARTLALIMVAMAAAPGFSPLLGGALNSLVGWRGAFVLVGVLGLVLAAHYVVSTGETHPADRRASVSAGAIVKGYAHLLIDGRFIVPAASVSLVLGALYAFFATAPAILMDGFGFSSLGLGLFFATTVFVVFGAGLLAPRLAHRRGQRPVALAGIAIALGGGILLLLGAQTTTMFSLSLAVFLLGMGMVNPLGTAIALQPFGMQAGTASALLGFLQMGSAALAISIASSLDLAAYSSLGIVLAGCTGLSLIVFAIGMRQRSSTSP
ncbi:multidrug effflux MFS transporter [Pseudoxanthomonas putridarboris]|uniref:Bcr/CflA family efflux transporter n=1 Tax=Pseudoxanthomonas putridarboris TaxID=752605 RepID=A0ABU9J4E0_9GAMM